MTATIGTRPAPPTSVERVVAARRNGTRHDRRVLFVLAAVVLGLLCLALCVGTTVTSPLEVGRVLLGQDVPGTSFVVGVLRVPRALGGLLVGIAFGAAGAIFQTLLRNTLASPDVIGVSSGASAAAVVGISFFGLSGSAVSIAAFGGALAAAAAIYLLAYRRGVAGARFILVGIAIGAALQAVVSYALTRAGISSAQEAVVWMTGSLSQSLWPQVIPLAIAVAILLPLALAVGRRLDVMRLGDDTATSLGVPVERSRLMLLLVAVALAAVGTAAAGPVAFVAFLSCPIASRLLRGTHAVLPASCLVGAIIVLAADFTGQHFFGLILPAGVITGAIGAPYLLWLLAHGRMNGANS